MRRKQRRGWPDRRAASTDETGARACGHPRVRQPSAPRALNSGPGCLRSKALSVPCTSCGDDAGSGRRRGSTNQHSTAAGSTRRSGTWPTGTGPRQVLRSDPGAAESARGPAQVCCYPKSPTLTTPRGAPRCLPVPPLKPALPQGSLGSRTLKNKQEPDRCPGTATLVLGCGRGGRSRHRPAPRPPPDQPAARPHPGAEEVTGREQAPYLSRAHTTQATPGRRSSAAPWPTSSSWTRLCASASSSCRPL